MAIELSEKQIKDGWQIVKFGQIAKEIRDTTNTPTEDGLEFYVGLEHLDPQSLRITRKGVIAEDNPSFTLCFKAGQILFGKRRSYQKKAAVADFDGICSGDIIVIEEIKGKIIPGLLPFIVQSDAFFDWAEKTSSGSLSPRTKWKALAEFELTLPPIDRQKEILKVLVKVEEASVLVSGSIARCIQTKNVLSVHIYEPKKNKKLKNKCLDELSLKIQDGTHFSPKTQASGIKYITSKNIKFGHLDITDIDFISDGDHAGIYKRCDVRKGDILLTKDGANTGNVCVNPLDEEFSLLSSVAFIRPNENLNASYLFHYLMSPLCQRNIKSSMDGNAITRLTLKKIKAIMIPVCAICEQKQIGEALDIFELVKKQLIKKRNHLQYIRRRISEDYLRGIQ